MVGSWRYERLSAKLSAASGRRALQQESLPRAAGARAAARPGTFGLPRRRHAARTYVLGLPRDIAKRRTDGEEEEGQEGQVAS